MFTVTDSLTSRLQKAPGVGELLIDGELPPARFNIAPTQPIVAVAKNGQQTVAAAVRWGLVPHWAKSMPKTPYFNARAETWREKPTFRDAEPCLIPMNGWYEWKDKHPYFVSKPAEDGAPELFFAAGLWTRCGDLVSATVITTASHGQLTELHHRMPRVLDDAELSSWLGLSDWAVEGQVGHTSPETVAALRISPANRAVGNIANDGKWLLAED